MTTYNGLKGRLIRFFLFFFLFSFIAFSVIFDYPWVSAFDHGIQTVVFSLRNQFLTAVFTPLTYSGNWQFVTALCLVLLALPATRRRYGLPMTASAVVSVSLYQILKYSICRIRPDVSLHLIEQGGFSFPSGHTLSCVAVWGTFLLLTLHYRKAAGGISPAAPQRSCPDDRRTTTIVSVCVIYIALMGFSRIYLGVHWPTDVLASYCLGLAFLIPVARLIEKSAEK